MKNRLFILLLAALLLLAGAASADVLLPDDLEAIEENAFAGDLSLTGRVVLPGSVMAVGSRAFAASGVHALVIPEDCAVIEADVLADADAAYVHLLGADTLVTGSAFADVPFVFGPEGGSAAGLAGFYASETLVQEGGLYYSLTDDAALPLCAVDRMSDAAIKLPKFVSGKPVRSLDTLNLTGCVGLTDLQVPSYLTRPAGLNATTYPAITISEPVPSVTETNVGESVTWTTSSTNTYGEVSYVWTFVTGTAVSSLRTAEPTVTQTMANQGVCTVTVAVTDELGDHVSIAGGSVTVGAPVPVYRALLVGNTYPSSDSALPGPDTDVAAMRTMLSSMPGTDYSISTRLNITASAMDSAIRSTFANAREYDVSLFYYSGHGTNIGSLVGIGNSTLSVNALRTILDTIPGTKIVIIDACYSGHMIGKSVGSSSPAAFNSAVVSAFAARTKANLAADNYIVLTSCTSGQYSQSITDDLTGHAFGLFTYGVCYGSGYDEWNEVFLGSLPADANADQAISLSEAASYAQERVTYIESLMSAADAELIDQNTQFYGDSSYILWAQ